MSKDFSSTHLGRRPAGPEDEREVLLRAGQALLAARLHELDEREVVFAIADLLDRANYVLETSADITVLGGAQGTYVNGRRFDLVPERPDAAFELKDGFPARGLAGLRITATLDQESLRAFLAAWRVEPTGSPREALERFREVHEGERAGRGLPPEGPLEIVLLPGDGKLPLPLVPPPAAVGPIEDEGDDAPPPADEDDDQARAALGRLAGRGDPKPRSSHGKTARRHSKDVIPEDLGSAARHPVPSGAEPTGDEPSDEGHGYEGSSSPQPGEEPAAEDATGESGGESLAGPASWAGTESKSPSASSWVAKADSPSGSSWASKSGTKSPSGSGWASKSGTKSPSGSSWAGKDPAASWIKDAAEEATEGGDASAEYGAAIEALANATQVRPAGDVISQDLQAALKRAAAKALGDDLPAQPLPTQAEPATPETAGPETDPEAVKSSTSVRPASEVIGEDLAERADSSAVRRAVASSEDDMERVGSSTAVRAADAATAPVPAEAEGEAPPESTPVRLEAPSSSTIEDLSPEASKANLVYARLVSRTGRALSAAPADYDRALAAVRRSAVEILNGLAQTPFEDRLLALTGFPAPDDRARHGANTAIYSVLAGRACGLGKVPLADLCVAAALHDEGETDAEGRVDRWPRALARILGATTVSDTTLLRTVLAYERTGPKGSVARPSPGSKTARLEARIVACASAFDEAVTGTGDYPGIRADLALERLEPAGHDPAAVKALAAALGAYPRGVLVTLAPSGDRAVVLACGGRRNDRPRVRIFADANGAPIDVREVEMSSAYSDLSVERIEDDTALGVDAKAHLMAWG